jgi:hypothetical protein
MNICHRRIASFQVLVPEISNRADGGSRLIDDVSHTGSSSVSSIELLQAFASCPADIAV